VSDTGTGMSPEIMTRAFDPFFTTKAIGEGTGLGLSQVFGFVKQSGGHVKLYSEPGRGTSVRIFLQHMEGEVEAPALNADQDLPIVPGLPVLVVEDDDGVRNYSTQCLRELGCKVLEASDGLTALRMLGAHPEVKLLFTDVGMPGMDGRELAARARKLRPHLQVLYTTGYARDAIFQDGILDQQVELLTKPFNRVQLAQRLRIIDARSAH
jgi:CheY-like chemotaxis protein